MKGRAETINSTRMLHDLKQVAAMNDKNEKRTKIQEGQEGEKADSPPLLLPVYDRVLHDPVDHSLLISKKTTRVVIVEGLHLLRNEQNWKDIRAMFMTLYYVRFNDGDVQKERVMQRRIRGGISRQWASPRYDQIDAVIGAEIEQESLHVRKNKNENTCSEKSEKSEHSENSNSSRMIVMSMCTDTYGRVQLERKDVYEDGMKVRGYREHTFVECIVKTIVGCCAFTLAYAKGQDFIDAVRQ